MPDLIDLVEALGVMHPANVNPATVDQRMPYWNLQRANHSTNFVLIGKPDVVNGPPRMYPVHAFILARESVFFRQFCQRPHQLSPVLAYGMDMENEDIQRLVDYVYLGIYAFDAVAYDWRLSRIPDVHTNTRMYRMGVRFDIPSLRSFALQAIEWTFQIAERQDVLHAINDVWNTPDENDDLRTMLIQKDMDVMISNQINVGQWLDRTPTPDRHPA